MQDITYNTLAELSADEINWDVSTTDIDADPDPLVAAIIDGDAYRWLAQRALAYAHDLHLQLERQREAYAQLIREYRSLRERLLRGDAGARRT